MRSARSCVGCARCLPLSRVECPHASSQSLCPDCSAQAPTRCGTQCQELTPWAHVSPWTRVLPQVRSLCSPAFKRRRGVYHPGLHNPFPPSRYQFPRVTGATRWEIPPRSVIWCSTHRSAHLTPVAYSHCGRAVTNCLHFKPICGSCFPTDGYKCLGSTMSPDYGSWRRPRQDDHSGSQ